MLNETMMRFALY